MKMSMKRISYGSNFGFRPVDFIIIAYVNTWLWS